MKILKTIDKVEITIVMDNQKRRYSPLITDKRNGEKIKNFINLYTYI